MLDIQRHKFETRDRLKAAGYSAEEIKEQLNAELLPFKPAFINGKRVIDSTPLPEPQPIKKKSRRSSTSVQF